MENETYMKRLKDRLQIEFKKQDRSGVYGYTQRSMAYNSNRIEGSTLTEKQTASMFETGILYVDDPDMIFRTKDIEEMNGHFLMFNKMLDTLDLELTEELIKAFHYELKSGVFEDRANGYAIGDYKKRPNMIGIYETVLPSQVSDEISQLLAWYNNQDISLEILAEFHTRYESIHPFQDGNGRVGRLIMFKECLKNNICPFIIDDTMKDEIRVTVVATGVRQDRAEKVSGMKAQPRKVTTAPSHPSAPTQQVAQGEQRPVSQPSFERQPNFDYNETPSMPQPGVRPAAATPQQEQSAFGNWDLRRDNISRPETGQLDSQLTMSTFSSDVEDDDELETPPFFKNR